MSSSASFPRDHDNGPAVNGVTWSFLTLAVVSVILRCYVRIFMIKSFGYDDILIVVTLVIMFFLLFPDQHLTAYNH
jgi:hypothetical protein